MNKFSNIVTGLCIAFLAVHLSGALWDNQDMRNVGTIGVWTCALTSIAFGGKE